MKKTLSALVAVAVLAGPVFAADTDANAAGNTTAKDAQDQKRVEEIHTHTAKKKAKKNAKKANTNSTKSEAGKSDNMAPTSK